MHFLIFSNWSFCQFCYQISSVAQCVELTEFTEFLHTIFKLPIFEKIVLAENLQVFAVLIILKFLNVWGMLRSIKIEGMYVCIEALTLNISGHHPSRNVPMQRITIRFSFQLKLKTNQIKLAQYQMICDCLVHVFLSPF